MLSVSFGRQDASDPAKYASDAEEVRLGTSLLATLNMILLKATIR